MSQLLVPSKQLFTPELLVPGRKPIGAVEPTDRTDALFLYNEGSVTRSLTGVGGASAYTSGFSISKNDLVCPTGAEGVTLPVSYYNRSVDVTLTFRANFGDTGNDSVKALFAMFPTSGLDDYFVIYHGDGVTASLSNEILTIAHSNGGSTNIVGYTTATRTLLYDSNPHTVTVTADGTTWRMWIDGVEMSLTSGIGSNVGLYYDAQLTTATLMARKINGAFSLASGVELEFFRWDARLLPDGKIAALGKNPYQFLKPEGIPDYFPIGAPAAASTTTYFIPADLVLTPELLTPHTKPKHGTVRLKRDHFAVRDEAFFLPLLESAGDARSAVNSLRGQFDGDMVRVGTPWGVGADHDNTNGKQIAVVDSAGASTSIYTTTQPRPSSTRWTGVINVDDGSHALFSNNDAADPRMRIGISNTSLVLYSGALSTSVSIPDFGVGKLLTIGVVWETSNAVTFYANGRQIGTSSLALSGSTTAGAFIGNVSDGGSNSINGITLGFSARHSVMRADEFAALERGLWGMYESRIPHVALGTPEAVEGATIPILYNHYRNLMAT